jgi:hypothetical protein
MTRRKISAAIVAGLVASIIAIAPTAAFAHEQRTVGRYHVEVGFGDEPPYAGFRNSVQLILTQAASDKPVTDLGDTLKVTVKTGTQEMPLNLEPNFEVGGDGTPGDYRAWFIPTASGTYTFQFAGTIKGQPFNQSFTSGPTTFDDVHDPTAVEFPQKVPTGSQLSDRLSREVPRLNAALAADRSKARHDAGTAKLLAIVALAVGVVGLVAGGLSLAAARGARRAVPSPQAAPAMSEKS